MTVEERAKDVFDSDKILWLGPDRARLEQRIIQTLRDQIEECAKIVAGEAMLCSKGDEAGHIKAAYVGLHDAWLRIRALAAPKEEGKES